MLTCVCKITRDTRSPSAGACPRFKSKVRRRVQMHPVPGPLAFQFRRQISRRDTVQSAVDLCRNIEVNTVGRAQPV
jgi:hypothetical protein